MTHDPACAINDGGQCDCGAWLEPTLYVVGSIVWFANGTMATQRLAEGDRDSCKKFYETAEHPLQPGDVLHPARAPVMLCVTKAEWDGLIANAAATDAQGRKGVQ